MHFRNCSVMREFAVIDKSNAERQMSIPSGGSKIIRSLTETVLKWRSDWIKRKRTLNKLSELNYNAEAEIARLASELGVPSAEIKMLQMLVSRNPWTRPLTPIK